MSSPSIEGAIPTKLISVGQLGGTKVSYALPKPISGSKPTLVLINALTASATFWKPQLSDETLSNSANLIALVPLGHGLTTTVSPAFTYWDSAFAFLQALDQLGVKKFVVAGSSQGGWIAARMALLAPDRVLGLIPICSTMDGNTPRLLELGCIDLATDLTKAVKSMKEPEANWSFPYETVQGFAELSLGPNPPEEQVKFNHALASKHYVGDAGRLKFRQIMINLLSRDSLHVRLDSITCPVLWIRGSEDKIFTEEVAKGDIELFGSSDVKFETISGGYHAPSITHAQEVNKLLEAFIKKNGGKADARALREAVGMVDI